MALKSEDAFRLFWRTGLPEAYAYGQAARRRETEEREKKEETKRRREPPE